MSVQLSFQELLTLKPWSFYMILLTYDRDKPKIAYRNVYKINVVLVQPFADINIQLCKCCAEVTISGT